MKFKKILTIILSILTISAALVVPMSVSAATRVGTNLMSKITWASGWTNTDTGVQYTQAQANWLRNSNQYIDVSAYESIKFEFNDSVNMYNVLWYDSDKNYLGSICSSSAMKYSGVNEFPVEGAYANFVVYNANGASAEAISSYKIYGIVNKYENIIDTTKKGSITINKYEMGDISKATNKGTGESSDSAKVPSNAKLFAGVTFTVKKIAGLDDKYFQGKGTPLPTPEEAKKMTVIGSPTSKTTGNNGIVTFTDLPLGIYLVEETAAPNHVMKKSPDSVISIPFTDVSGKEWKYDAYLYPKNETKYSDLKIHKSDYKTKASLSDTQFTLERKTESGAWAAVKTGLTTDANGYVTVKDLPVNNFYRITETKAHSLYILDTTNNVCNIFIDSQGRICNSGKTPYNLNNDPTLFEFTPNTKPEIDKFIDKSKGKNTNLVKETTFAHTSENDRNYYTVIVTTPNVELNKLTTFKMTDQINSTLQAPRVESVTDGNGNVIAQGATGYTATVSSGNLVTVNFSTADNTVIKKNTKYYVSISCFHSLTTEPILNHAQLEYTSVVNTDKTEKITTDETKTISGAYELLKTDTSDKGLANAVFSIYATESDAISNKNPISVRTYANSSYGTTFKTGADGKVKIIYLDFGDDVENGEKEYWIAEIQAPSGFMLLAKPVKITVNRRSGSYTNTQMKIVNIPQPDLPKTGGYGTFIFSAIGIVSLSTAGILFYIKRRRKSSSK